MQIGFQCPSGEKVTHAQCLEKCVMEKRCATKPTLFLMSRQRPWNGLPSVTTCIRGTMEAFLRFTVDYYVKPKKCAFMLLGTRHHEMLDDAAKQMLGVISEERFEDEDVGGTPDYLELAEGILTDYKTWGSYSVAKNIGLVKVDEPTGEVYKTGEHKGQPKTHKVIHLIPEQRDDFDAAMQLNRYRIEFEKKGHKINAMQIQATVRDGGVRAATSTGVTEEITMIDIRRIDDAEVMAYFERKSLALRKAMAEGKWTEICSPHERWDDRKCKTCDLCNVAFTCPHGKEMLAAQVEEEE